MADIREIYRLIGRDRQRQRGGSRCVECGRPTRQIDPESGWCLDCTVNAAVERSDDDA